MTTEISNKGLAREESDIEGRRTGLPFTSDDLAESIEHAIVVFGNRRRFTLELHARLDHIERVEAEQLVTPAMAPAVNCA